MIKPQDTDARTELMIRPATQGGFLVCQETGSGFAFLPLFAGELSACLAFIKGVMQPAYAGGSGFTPGDNLYKALAKAGAITSEDLKDMMWPEMSLEELIEAHRKGPTQLSVNLRADLTVGVRLTDCTHDQDRDFKSLHSAKRWLRDQLIQKDHTS